MAQVKSKKKKVPQSNPQIPQEFKDLPYFYLENGHTMCSIPLNIIHSLKECPHLENISKDCVKQAAEIPDLQAAAPITTNILTPQQYLKQEKQGLIPRMKNQEVLQYVAEDLCDTTMQVISMQYNICLTSLTCAKLKEKNEICHSISTRAVKCDGVFFVLQHGFQYGFHHA